MTWTFLAVLAPSSLAKCNGNKPRVVHSRRTGNPNPQKPSVRHFTVRVYYAKTRLQSAGTALASCTSCNSGLICLGLTSPPPGQEDAGGSLKEPHQSSCCDWALRLDGPVWSGAGGDKGFSSCQIASQGPSQKFVKRWKGRKEQQNLSSFVRCLCCCSVPAELDLLWLHMCKP